MDITDLIKEAKKHSQVDPEKIRSAYLFAQKAHAGQMRMSGEPYITHPLAVAIILAEYGADEESILAALLHDVVEDTSHTLDEIERLFGKGVARMVDAVTKLPHVNTEIRNEHTSLLNKIESLRKIFEVMEHDVRIIVIKLCDRLHNMRSLFAFRPEKQKRIAQETLDIFVKIADRLSMGEIRDELENLGYHYLYAEKFPKFVELEKSALEDFKRNHKRMEERLQDQLPTSRRKQIHFKSEVNFAEMKTPQDTPEIRHEVSLVVEKDADCFLALQDVHALWNNVRGTFRDFVTLPRSNGYQALETSVVKSDGSIIRFIIQTASMYEYSRKGVILSCFGGNKSSKKVQMPWMEHLKKIHKETKYKSESYINALENDILKGSIIVYTGDNKRLFLPPKSTALDAAFLHLGDNALRVGEIIIDQHSVQFSQRLKDWQTIHFNLSAKLTILPKWLDWIQTSYARSFIFEYFRTLPHAQQHSIAEQMIQEALTEMGSGYIDEISKKRRLEVAKKLTEKSWNDLLEAVCTGKHDVQTVVHLLFDKHVFQLKKFKADIQIRRNNGADGIISVLDYFKDNSIPFVHNKTRRFDQYYLDDFTVDWSLAQRVQFFSFIKEYLHYSLFQLKPLQKSFVPYLYVFSVALFWAINTFVSRYLMQTGLTVQNTTELRFLSSSFILFAMAAILRRYHHEDYSPLKFSFSFFFITGVLTLYTYLIHETLFLTQSINYIVPVSISFILVGLFYAFQPFFSKSSVAKILTILAICSLSIVFLFQQNFSVPQLIGTSLAFAVLILHMTYNYFGNIYQQKYKVKSRSLLLLAFMFLFASLIFIPFVQWQNFLEVSPVVILIAVVNGFITGGVSHFFFFESSKYLPHYKVTYAMSFMVITTLIIGYWWDGSINPYNLSAALLMILAFFMAGYWEQKVYAKNESNIQQLG
jgi:RelA/SpoT family (p)ppGpp synthetase